MKRPLLLPEQRLRRKVSERLNPTSAEDRSAWMESLLWPWKPVHPAAHTQRPLREQEDTQQGHRYPQAQPRVYKAPGSFPKAANTKILSILHPTL